jgi:hypothetical protein
MHNPFMTFVNLGSHGNSALLIDPIGLDGEHERSMDSVLNILETGMIERGERMMATSSKETKIALYTQKISGLLNNSFQNDPWPHQALILEYEWLSNTQCLVYLYCWENAAERHQDKNVRLISRQDITFSGKTRQIGDFVMEFSKGKEKNYFWPVLKASLELYPNEACVKRPFYLQYRDHDDIKYGIIRVE